MSSVREEIEKAALARLEKLPDGEFLDATEVGEIAEPFISALGAEFRRRLEGNRTEIAVAALQGLLSNASIGPYSDDKALHYAYSAARLADSLVAVLQEPPMKVVLPPPAAPAAEPPMSPASAPPATQRRIAATRRKAKGRRR